MSPGCHSENNNNRTVRKSIFSNLLLSLSFPCIQTSFASASSAPAEAAISSDNPIVLTEKALNHLQKLRSESGGEAVYFRLGVKSGGCSGMSYTMDFAKPTDVNEGEDMVFNYSGDAFKMVVDTKSLLYLFGLQLDYSDALIDGGFKFSNPNAASNCGCGKSFGV